MSTTLRIRIPKYKSNYKSKVDITKLNKLIRLNKVKNKRKVSDLVVCFLKSFSFKNQSIEEKFREIRKEYKHVKGKSLKTIIYLCYNVLNYIVYYKDRNCYDLEREQLINKINNFIRKNFRRQENDMNSFNDLFYNLRVG